MRWIPAVLLLVLPVDAAQLCVEDGEWICCHAMCDLYGPVPPDGYSTEAPYVCGSGYGPFAISSSSESPDQNVGPLPADHRLYLWVTADDAYGYSDGWARLGGDLEVVVFTPLETGVTWDPPEKQVHVGMCTHEPIPVASLLVFGTTDLPSETWGRIKSLYLD